MDEPLIRTSVTVDEAVAILLGWASGPIVFASVNEDPSFEEQEILDGLTYSLADALEELQTSPESVKAEAAIDGLSDTEVAAKLAEVAKNQRDVQLANTYLCAVNDELNRGAQSGLRVDGKLTNEYLTYITLTSFNEWMQGKFGKTILTPAVTLIEPVATKPTVRQRLGDQEKAITNPWQVPDPIDPVAEQDWYISARYFARQLIREDTTLLQKRDKLAGKVVKSLSDVGIYKRGGKKPFNPDTVKKAFSNVTF